MYVTIRNQDCEDKSNKSAVLKYDTNLSAVIQMEYKIMFVPHPVFFSCNSVSE